MTTKENTMDAIEAGLMGYEIDAQGNEYFMTINGERVYPEQEKVNE